MKVQELKVGEKFKFDGFNNIYIVIEVDGDFANIRKQSLSGKWQKKTEWVDGNETNTVGRAA